jgi:hypothetical protein
MNTIPNVMNIEHTALSRKKFVLFKIENKDNSKIFKILKELAFLKN